MSTIAIKDLNAVSTLSDLEVKSVVGGLFDYTRVFKVTSISQSAGNIAAFSFAQSVNQVALILG